jgi:hypothetical protein
MRREKDAQHYNICVVVFTMASEGGYAEHLLGGKGGKLVRVSTARFDHGKGPRTVTGSGCGIESTARGIGGRLFGPIERIRERVRCERADAQARE